MGVNTTIENGVARLVMAFNKVNALSIDEVKTLIEEIRHCATSDEVRVILLGNEGKGFCVGANVKELNADNNLIGACNQGWYRLFAAVYDAPVPVISVIDGYCIGGGIGIAGASDIVFASDRSIFSLPEVKVGALGGGSHLIRLVGQQKGRMMMYTGEAISAEECARYGAIEAVTSPEELWNKAEALAAKIAAINADAIRLAKESLNITESADINRSYRFEQGFTLELYTSPDAAKARAAQVEAGFKK